MAKQDNIKAQENFDRYSYLRDNGHLRFTEKANKCDNYFQGIQWDELVKRRLERMKKPVLTLNMTLATIAAVMGEQLENRASIAYIPSKEGTGEIAEQLTKTWIQIANNNKYDWLESDIFDDGVITSRGFIDLRIAFKDSLQGEVIMRKINPRNVLIDADGETYDPDDWNEVIITKWMNPLDIELLYGKDAADALKQTSGSLPYNFDNVERHQRTFAGFQLPPSNDTRGDQNLRRYIRVLERQFNVIRNAPHFVDPATGDMRLVPVNWTVARAERLAAQLDLVVIRKKVKQIYWTVTADNWVLHDEVSPFKHFTPIPYFPYFRHGQTIGIVENLVSPQELLNKTTSQELHVVNTTANSGWKLKRNSLRNMTIEELETRGAETGLVLELEDAGDAEKITPNPIPQGLDRIGFKAEDFIKKISGVSDSIRGFDRADVAAKAIEAKQQAGSVNLAKPFDNLARTRFIVARNTLDLVQQFYTEERILNITGLDLGQESEEIVINQRDATGRIVNDLTVGEYDVAVQTVPSRKSYSEGQFAQATALRELGVNIPDDILIENSNLGRKAEIAKRITGEGNPVKEEMEQLELQKARVEVANEQSEAILKRANAMLAMARVAQVQGQTRTDARQAALPGGGEGDAVKTGEAVKDGQRKDDDQDLKRQQAEEKMQLDRERFEFDKEMKEREAIEARRDKLKKEREQQAKASKGGGS